MAAREPVPPPRACCTRVERRRFPWENVLCVMTRTLWYRRRERGAADAENGPALWELRSYRDVPVRRGAVDNAACLRSSTMGKTRRRPSSGGRLHACYQLSFRVRARRGDAHVHRRRRARCGAVRKRGGDARPRLGATRDDQPAWQRGPGANFMAARLAPLGFQTSVIQTPAPGKAHLIARLASANPVGKPVLLSAHSDTVGVERDLWSIDPFAGVIRNSFLFGRGSFDDKGSIAVFAAAAMRLARAHVPLKRDVVLVFEGDEEGGDYGIEWLADHQWNQLDAAFSLNEGGIIGTNRTGRPNLAAVTVRDKISFSVTLETRGVSTHSSRPQRPTAIDRLTRALARLSRPQGGGRLSPLTRRYFRAAARASHGRLAVAL